MSSQLLELGRRAASPAAGQTRALARLHLFDALVAALAAAATPEGVSTARHLDTVAPAPGGAAAADIVLTLARRIRATELDDLQLEPVTTAAAAIVPALAGAAAVIGKGTGTSTVGADAVLDAATAGYDAMWTLGLAAGGPDFLYRQGGWPSLAGAAPAAAVTAGRLLGLDAEEIAHAVALAVLSTPRSLRGNGEDGRWFSFGLAVTGGFQAALAARSGSRGDLGLLDQERSRGGTPGRELFPGLRPVLERRWETGTGLAGAHLKQWASAGQVAAAIDAAGVLQDSHGFSAGDVTAIETLVPPAYKAMIDQPDGSGRVWSLVSAQYQVAARLLHPEDLFDCARPVLRGSPGFRRLMDTVRVREEASLSARHPRSYPARVSVTLRGGTTVDCLSDGRSPSPHWDWAALLAKARAVVPGAGAGRRVDPLHEAIAGFSDSAGFLSAALSVVEPDGGDRGHWAFG
ncbi:MAG TPA: MmgE/PrpD family protein [Trebonia sp.]